MDRPRAFAIAIAVAELGLGTKRGVDRCGRREGAVVSHRWHTRPMTSLSDFSATAIDGTVYVASRRPLRAGDIVTVKVERSEEYDLHGVAV